MPIRELPPTLEALGVAGAWGSWTLKKAPAVDETSRFANWQTCASRAIEWLSTYAIDPAKFLNA